MTILKKEFNTGTLIVIAAILYSFFTHFEDAKQGFIDGWNSTPSAIKK